MCIRDRFLDRLKEFDGGIDHNINCTQIGLTGKCERVFAVTMFSLVVAT